MASGEASEEVSVAGAVLNVAVEAAMTVVSVIGVVEVTVVDTEAANAEVTEAVEER